MIPESFGQAGHYRYDSINELMAKLPEHGNDKTCGTCHEEILETHDAGKHATVSCETCHAPLSVHVKEGEKIASMPIGQPLTLCAYCHQANRARPAEFPQIVFKEHLVELGVELTDEISPGVCTECHEAHDPL